MITRIASALLLCLVVSQTALAKGPKFTDTPTLLGTIIAGETYDIDLRTLLKELGTPPLNWFPNASKPLPSFLTLDSANNRLSGTPTAADAGSYEFMLSVTDATGEGGDINHITRITVLSPPKWKFPQIDLGFQNEGIGWAFDLNTIIDNPAGGNLTFTATGLPSWMSLDGSSGILNGQPERTDVGAYTGITFTASGIGGSASAPGFGEVLIVYKKPKWNAKQIALEDAFEDKSYMRDLTEFVVNPEGIALTYEVVTQTPPPWTDVGETTGELFGIPGKTNIGAFEVTIQLKGTMPGGGPVSDASTFSFKVIHVNHPPQWLANPINLADAATGVKYSQSLAKSFRDIDDGDTHTFEILPNSGPPWATINASTGEISGTPGKNDVGVASWIVKVTDNYGASDVTTVQVNVLKSNEPPRWVLKPTIVPEAKEDFAFNVDLSQRRFVIDPDDDPLIFEQLDGPTWFSISPRGLLMGKPGADDVGIHKFNVKVSDGISGSDVTEIQLLVEHTNHPPEWLIDPITLKVKEDQSFDISIAGYASDPDPNDDLVFSAISGAPWAQLSPTGSFSGTPGKAEAGKTHTYTVRVADPYGLYADVTVFIEVEHVNHPPMWTQNPITLSPNAFEETFYSHNLAPYASDPDDDVLTFAKVDGPAWIRISSSGGFTGTPSRADVGTHQFRVRVNDPDLEFATTTFIITVESINHQPRWRQDPILMSDGFEGDDYEFDLTKYAVDDDGDPLEFSLVTGPAWMKVSADGIVSGIPSASDVGPFNAVFAVTDNLSDPVQTSGEGEIFDKNHPPVVGIIPLFTVKERTQFSADLNAWVTDPDNDTLNYTVEGNPPSWFRLQSNGKFFIDNPKYADIGEHSIAFKVDDGEFPAHGVLKIKVIRNPRPPRWLEDPILRTAKTNQPFSGDLNSVAVDDDGIPLTFSKLDGDSWLTVATTGDMSGTPRDQHLGPNEFRVQVCNDLLCADATLIIDVKLGTAVETITVDAIVPGARSDNLWVIDNSRTCNKLISALKRNIHVYYDALDAAQIHHSGILISADAHRFDGIPIHASGQQRLFTWATNDIVTDFGRRVSAAFSSGGCGNCYNSPIWSMFQFYERVPTMSDVYHNGYIEDGVPMDVMIISRQRDHFKWYTKYLPDYKYWDASDFADSFIEFHDDEGQDYRISTITPKCPRLISNAGDHSAMGAENSYEVIVDATGGTSYTYTCNYDLGSYLEDYAKKVIFRSSVLAKRSIKLSKVPIETHSMKVTIGGNAITTPDQWRYEASTNEVLLFWDEIGLENVKPGDIIRIQYRVS